MKDEEKRLLENMKRLAREYRSIGVSKLMPTSEIICPVKTDE